MVSATSSSVDVVDLLRPLAASAPSIKVIYTHICIRGLLSAVLLAFESHLGILLRARYALLHLLAGGKLDTVFSARGKQKDDRWLVLPRL